MTGRKSPLLHGSMHTASGRWLGLVAKTLPIQARPIRPEHSRSLRPELKFRVAHKRPSRLLPTCTRHVGQATKGRGSGAGNLIRVVAGGPRGHRTTRCRPDRVQAGPLALRRSGNRRLSRLAHQARPQQGRELPVWCGRETWGFHAVVSQERAYYLLPQSPEGPPLLRLYLASRETQLEPERGVVLPAAKERCPSLGVAMRCSGSTRRRLVSLSRPHPASNLALPSPDVCGSGGAQPQASPRSGI